MDDAMVLGNTKLRNSNLFDVFLSATFGRTVSRSKSL